MTVTAHKVVRHAATKVRHAGEHAALYRRNGTKQFDAIAAAGLRKRKWPALSQPSNLGKAMSAATLLRHAAILPPVRAPMHYLRSEDGVSSGRLKRDAWSPHSALRHDERGGACQAAV
jgi:hypothetical protein